MDNSSAPDRPPEQQRRPRWLVAVAVFALAGALAALVSLRPNATTEPAQTADVDLAALAEQSPLAMPLYEQLSQQGSAAAPAAAAAKTIEIMNFQYSPATVEVSVGDTVTWTNHDSAPHNVVVTDGPAKFESPLLKQGESFSHQFTSAGTYSYYCSVHPDMKASVTVGGGAPPTTEPPTSPPTTPPTTPPTSPPTMPHPTEPPAPGGCVPAEALKPLMDHIKAAHLETSPGQQVADILNLDQYVKSHTVMLEQVLEPVFNGSADKVVADTLAPIWAHLKAAHLEASPGQQVADILNLDQYIKTHTVWLEQVLTPLLDQVSC